MGLLDGDIANIVGDAADFLMIDCTITQPTGNRVSDGQGGFTITPVVTAARGLVEDYSDLARANGVPGTDRKITLLATKTTVIPARDDLVTIRGRSYKIINVVTDPALATYTVQGR